MYRFLQTEGLKQLILLGIIACIGILIVWQLYYFIPGFLGAITLYICFRHVNFWLIRKLNFKSWISALVIILGCLLVIVCPLWMLTDILIPKFTMVFNNTDLYIEKANQLLEYVNDISPRFQVSSTEIQNLISQVTVIGSKLINATASVLVNTAVALFVLYFLLVDSRNIENRFITLLPLKPRNKDALWRETQKMIISNAVGIPVLMACQGIIAAFGYWLFGVSEPLVWGIITGVASVLPVVGTMVIWIPIGVYFLIEQDMGSAIGLLLYGTIVISNIDNVLRFTLLKKIGDVHPLITVFGVILGIQLFGVMGLIFGPLLITYFVLLIKIYRLEFSSNIGKAEHHQMD